MVIMVTVSMVTMLCFFMKDDHYCGRGQNFFEVDDVVGGFLLCQHPGQHDQFIDSILSA